MSTPPPSVFISWAHTDEEWSQLVFRFFALLRESGIAAEVDLVHLHEPGIDWARFGPSKIEECDFTAVAVSESWKERWGGQNKPTEGAGAAGEANALRGRFQRNQEEFAEKIVLVLLPGVSESALPDDLRTFIRFLITDLNREDTGFIDLLRTITTQPAFVAPPLGEVPALPPLEPDTSLPRKENSAEIDAAVAAIDRELGVLYLHLKGIPEPQPWEGPHLPWWRLWHQLQGRIFELESRRAELRGDKAPASAPEAEEVFGSTPEERRSREEALNRMLEMVSGIDQPFYESSVQEALPEPRPSVDEARAMIRVLIERGMVRPNVDGGGGWYPT